jgi:hypothetical protein
MILAMFSSGCVHFGDCWPPVTANVRISPQFASEAGAPVVVAGAVRIHDADVSGVDFQGVPIAADRLTPHATRVTRMTTRAESLEFRGFPYPTWYVAFLDLDADRTLDPGEPFGVDPLNPRDTGCKAHTTEIEIDTVRSTSHPYSGSDSAARRFPDA